MDLLKTCAEKFNGARKSIGEGIALLWEVRETGAFRDGGFSSFGAYVEEECGINASQVSRYLTQYEHFAIKAGISNTQLLGIDPERLYLATKLSGEPAEQLEKARALSVKELKAQSVYEKTGEECAHTDTVTICRKCSKRLS